MPSPLHDGHAPKGELNEKLLGASSSSEIPQCTHARCWEKVSTWSPLLPARRPRQFVASSRPRRRRGGLGGRLPSPSSPPSAAFVAGAGSAQGRLRVGHEEDLGDALAEAQRRLDRVGESALDAVATHETVDDHLDRVLLVAGELERGPLGELDELAVDAGPGVALFGEVVEQGRVLALAPAHDRSEHLEAGALGQVAQAVDDLLRALAGDEPAAVGAVRLADAGVEQPQVVVDLRDRPDRRAGVAGGGFLVDGDRR